MSPLSYTVMKTWKTPPENPFAGLESALSSFFSGPAGQELKPGSRILIACSGGPDSVALVRALDEMSPQLRYDFFIGHVNHQLRGRESDKDADFVKELAMEIGWPLCTMNRPAKLQRSGNLEERAREMRYEALGRMAEKLKADIVLTAHTNDDQTETMLMNILRGSGPDGLAGIWPIRFNKSANLRLGRPLLKVSKSDILKYLKSRGFSFRQDVSNRDIRFTRNWLRNRVVPLLEERAPGFRKRAAQLADLMREEQTYWNDLMLRLKRVLLSPYRNGALLDFKKLLRYSPAVQRRFLRHVLGGDLLSFEAIENLRRWMAGPPTGGRLWQLRKGWTAERLSKSTGSPSTTVFWLRQSRTQHNSDHNREEHRTIA